MTTPSRLHVSYENILVPTDFSELSDRALEYAKSIARQANARLLLLHVNSPFNPSNPSDPPETAWLEASIILKQVEQRLEHAGDDLRSEGFRAGTLSVSGSLQEEILYVVQREQVDLVVLGAHARRGLERLLFGSDAESILRHVACPVITIGSLGAIPLEPVWRPKCIVCATTLVAKSAGMAAYAYELAHHYAAQFEWLNVVAEHKAHTDGWEVFASAVQGHLSADTGPLPAMQSLGPGGSPGTMIAEHARKLGADLIVMGAHTASVLTTHFGHGTVSQVFAEAMCPVMTLHDA
jgi:nucleotide-binding universal stress UspA family protein